MKRKRLEQKLDFAKATIDEQQEKIDELRAEYASLYQRPTIARLPEGDQEVYTVMITGMEMERDMLPVGEGSGFVRYIPGAVTITLVCTGPQPANGYESLQGRKFALVPAEQVAS